MNPNIGGSMDFLARTSTALANQRALCTAPQAAQESVLRDIADQARGTAFGLEHGVHEVRTLRDWQSAVPVRSYEELRPYVDRLLTGEQNVLTRSQPYALLKTSGTSGRPKLVPTTRHWRENYRGPALYAQWGLYFQLLGISRVYPWTALDLSWDRTCETDRHGDFPVHSISQRWESFGGSDWTPPWYGAPWFGDEVNRLESLDRFYAKARLIADRDVRLIVSVNPSKLVLFAEQIRDRSEEFIRDLHDGTLLGRPHPDLRPNPGMAARLAAIRSQDRPLTLTDVWPRLGLLVCWTSASARMYESWLRRLAPEVAILPFSTTGTEGIVTLPIDGHMAAGPLAVNQGVYEFFEMDADDRMTGDPLAPSDLTRGSSYRLVMSQANGMYRYDVGDTYRVVGWVGQVPRLEFTGRAGRNSSFTGEKLTESDLHKAVARTMAEFGHACPMFTGIPVWDTPPHYTVAVEYPASGDAPSPGRLADRLDAVLGEVNIEYAEKRSSRRLGGLQVVPLRGDAFKRLAGHRMRQGVAPAQLKHHWLQADSALLKLFQELDLLDGSRMAGPVLADA